MVGSRITLDGMGIRNEQTTPIPTHAGGQEWQISPNEVFIEGYLVRNGLRDARHSLVLAGPAGALEAKTSNG